MYIEELQTSECHHLLERAHLGRLACVADGQPYVVPTYYAWSMGYLYAFAILGRKIEWMRANPRVCMQVDEIVSHDEWETVAAFGCYEELPDTPDWEYQRKVAHSHLQQRASWWEPGIVSVGSPDHVASRPSVFYRINVETVTGRRARPDVV